MRIATITNWAYGLTLLLTFSSGAAFMSAASADLDERRAIDERLALVRIADDVELGIDNLTNLARLYVVRLDKADRQAWVRERGEVHVFDRVVARLAKLGTPDAELTELRTAEADVRREEALQREALAAADRNDPATAGSIMFGDRYKALDENIDASLLRFRTLLKTRTDTEVHLAQAEADRRDDVAKALLGLTAALFLGVLYFVLARRVSAPLTRMSHVVTRMADHDFEVDMPDDQRKDEIGDVTQALRMFRRNAVERDRLEREQRNDLQVKDRLSRMMHRMQGCETEAEIALVVACFAPQIFPSLAGHLFIFDPARDLLSTVSNWQDPAVSETDFTTTRCWSLRRGHPHRSRADGEDMVCQHLSGTRERDCLCVPLMAQGGTVGMLYFEEKTDSEPLPALDLYLDIMSENIGMALANIQLRSALRSLAIRDPLTGLANRRHLDETLNLELALAAKQQTPLACLMIDIDHFKGFNDEFGHDAGDMVMQHFAQVLVTHSRAQDVACRYGGEEFTLILPGADCAVAADRAEEIRATIRKVSLAYRGRPLPAVTVSIGVAVFPHNSDSGSLLAVADSALLEAKRAGRDRVVVAGVAPAPKTPRRVA